MEEEFFLGLRLNRGVDLSKIAVKYGDWATARLQPAVEELIADGLLQQRHDSIRLTPRGRLLSNDVFQAFLEPARTT